MGSHATEPLGQGQTVSRSGLANAIMPGHLKKSVLKPGDHSCIPLSFFAKKCEVWYVTESLPYPALSSVLQVSYSQGYQIQLIIARVLNPRPGMLIFTTTGFIFKWKEAQCLQQLELQDSVFSLLKLNCTLARKTLFKTLALLMQEGTAKSTSSNFPIQQMKKQRPKEIA